VTARLAMDFISKLILGVGSWASDPDFTFSRLNIKCDFEPEPVLSNFAKHSLRQ
jgi:hypothetical protein